MIYLDNAATTFSEKVIAAVLPSLCEGNPSSKHFMGELARKQIETARSRVADFLNSSPEDIIFTSSGSEANTLAILGLADHLSKLGLKHIITSAYEHHSVLNAMGEMEKRGFEVTYLMPKGGFIDCEDFKAAIRPDTGFASVMYVNNEIGTVNDIRGIYEVCKGQGLILHSDCVQAVGAVGVGIKIGRAHV